MMVQIVASLIGKYRCIIYNPRCLIYIHFDVYCTRITYYMVIFIWQSVQATGLTTGFCHICSFSKLQSPIDFVNVIINITLFYYCCIFFSSQSFYSLKLGFEPGLPQLLWLEWGEAGDSQHQPDLPRIKAIKLHFPSLSLLLWQNELQCFLQQVFQVRLRSPDKHGACKSDRLVSCFCFTLALWATSGNPYWIGQDHYSWRHCTN